MGMEHWWNDTDRGHRSKPELHLSGLIRTASPPDMQKIRMTGFFSENRLH